MTQSVILDKFKDFAKLKYKLHYDEFEEQKKSAADDAAREKIQLQQDELTKYHELLIKIFSSGHCFGFSLAHAAMAKMGKVKWWETLLKKVASWDGKSDSLANEIILPDAETVAGKKVTLEELFERAMYYVAPNQCPKNPTPPYKPKGMNQSNILSPSGFISEKDPTKRNSYFEYLDHGVIRTIQKRKWIAGNFSKKQLIDILDEKQCKDSIIQVYNGDHAIRMGYDGSNWIVYDPNYDHTEDKNDPDKPIQFIGTKEECIGEVIRILGTALCFEFASEDPNKKYDFPAYEKLTQTDLPSLCAGNGLFQLAAESTNELFSYLEMAEKSFLLRDAILAGCKNSFTKHFICSGNSLKSIMGNDHRLLPKLLNLGKNSCHYADMHANIIEALLDKGSDGNPPLKYLATYAPENIAPLLDFIVKDNFSLEFMLERFMDSDKDNKNTWSILSDGHKKIIANFFMKKILGVDENFYDKIPSANTLEFPHLLLKILLLKQSVGIKASTNKYTLPVNIENITPAALPDILTDIVKTKKIEQISHDSKTHPYIIIGSFISAHLPKKKFEILNFIARKLTKRKNNFSFNKIDQPFTHALLDALINTNGITKEKKEEAILSCIAELGLSGENISSKYKPDITSILKYKPALRLTIAFDLLNNNNLSLEKFKLLFPANTALSSTRKSKKTLLSLIIEKNCFTFVDYLLENKMLGNYSTGELGEALIDLIEKKQPKLAKKLLSEYPETSRNWINYESNNSLHLCLKENTLDTELFFMLVEDNPRLTFENTSHEFPLLIAAEKGYFLLIKQLFQDKRIVERHTNKQLHKIFHVLRENYQFELILVLIKQMHPRVLPLNLIRLTLEANSDIEFTLNTMLVLAEQGNFDFISKLCQETHIFAKHTDEQLIKLIDVLEKYNQLETIKILFSKLSTTSKQKQVAIYFDKRPALAKELLRINPTISKDYVDSKGNTFLHLCLQEEKPDRELISTLFQDNPKVATANQHGEFPLLIVASKGYFDLVSGLLQNKEIFDNHSNQQLFQLIEVLQKQNKHELVLYILTQREHLTYRAMDNTDTEMALNKQFFGIERQNNIFTKLEIVTALGRIGKNDIHSRNLVILLKQFNGLPIKDHSFQLFYHKHKKDQHTIAQRLLYYLNNKPIQIPTELNNFINSQAENCLLMKIITKFNPILQLKLKEPRKSISKLLF